MEKKADMVSTLWSYFRVASGGNQPLVNGHWGVLFNPVTFWMTPPLEGLEPSKPQESQQSECEEVPSGAIDLCNSFPLSLSIGSKVQSSG